MCPYKHTRIHGNWKCNNSIAWAIETFTTILIDKNYVATKEHFRGGTFTIIVDCVEQTPKLAHEGARQRRHVIT